MDATSSRVPGRRRPPRLAPAVAAGLLGLALVDAAGAQPAAREADLAAIRARVGELEARLRDIRERKRGLVGDLVEADYDLQLQGERLAEARRELQGARARLEAAESETGELEDRLARIRAAASRRVTGLYRMGGRGPVRLLASLRATDDLLGALRGLRYLVRRDVELRRSLNVARSELAVQLRALRFQRREVEILVDTEAARMGDLERLRRRRASLVAEVERQEAATAGEYEGWVDRQGKLADLMAQVAARGGLSLAGRRIQDYRGVLDRPIVGSIVRAFGPRRDPRYKTLVPHNGLQFAGLADESVRVVFPGRVVYAQPLEGYGETVIVLHSGRVFTLYAGLATLAVRTDELLSLGQVVGAADGGLYFEVREENRPVDPAEWIR
ncbi:MAG: peptidoglycan DD-metalloendopeptidase family protein [Acidobacteriota bacterium]|nr:peptidoglycan DD-metalloendopeptidase family protein [Acidobacteriota bacterium]MDH3522596.1 peptidoglycan DD-metalloendopeptidase family protein [Acidobacteriota bacterium]